jgi:hypothetical protein
MRDVPIYVVSKNRYENCLTVRFLLRDHTEFDLVVEHEQVEQYAKYGREHLLVLPQSRQRPDILRNWCFDDAPARGAQRFWILDNIWTLKAGAAWQAHPLMQTLP